MKQSAEPQKRAILYVRVSTRGKNQEESPDTQRRRLIAYCESMGYEWSEELVFCDFFSGTTLDRPGLKKVIEAVKEGRGNLIVSTRLDRLARTDEFPAYLRNVIKKHGADIACIEQSIDTSTSHGRMILGILTLVYQQYAEEVREKTRNTMRFLLSEGKWMWRAPFGTQPGAVKAIPEKHPRDWPLLLQIFEQSAAGRSDADILEWLNRGGHKTHTGAAWTYTSLIRTLTAGIWASSSRKARCSISNTIAACRWSCGRPCRLVARGPCCVDESRVAIRSCCAGWWSARTMQ